MSFEYVPATRTLHFNGRDSGLQWEKKDATMEKEIHVFCNVLLDQKGQKIEFIAHK